MTFFYVKSGGTATGDAGRAGTARTGTFAAMGASAYYDSISDALTVPSTSPVAGDEFRVSSVHSKNYASVVTYTFPAGGAGVSVVSVDDSNADQGLAGAAEATGGTNNDINFAGVGAIVNLIDISLTLSDDIQISSENLTLSMERGSINFTQSATQRLSTFVDGDTFMFNNTDLVFALGQNDVVFLMRGNACVYMYGGSITATVGDIDGLFDEAVNAAYMSRFVGVRMPTLQKALEGVGGTVGDDGFAITMDGCEVSSTFTPADEGFLQPSQKLLITNSSDVSAATEFQFFQRTYSGDVEDQDDAGIHRDESTAFPGGTKVSLKATSSATCSLSQPLIFDLFRFSELSGANQTIRIYFAVVNTETLTDTEVWAEVVYPDGTNKQTYNYASNRNSDVIAVGTTHTTDSGSTWKDGGSNLAGFNEYYMDIDTSVDVGADSVPVLQINVGLASTTIYFDTTYDLVV